MFNALGDQEEENFRRSIHRDPAAARRTFIKALHNAVDITSGEERTSGLIDVSDYGKEVWQIREVVKPPEVARGFDILCDQNALEFFN